MRNPYTQQLNVAIERALSKTQTLTVSYIQNRGKRLFTVRDLNIGPLSSQVYNFNILNSSYQPTGDVYSTPALSARQPRRHAVRPHQPGGKRRQAVVRRDGRATITSASTASFQGTISYTWSHEFDENQESGSNAIFFSSGPMGLYNGNYSLDKGNGNLDQRHRFVGTFIARPTFTKEPPIASATSSTAGSRPASSPWPAAVRTSNRSASLRPPTCRRRSPPSTGWAATAAYRGCRITR